MSDNAISADGVSIHYEVHGERTTALVFVHGWSCDRSYWNRQVGHFAQIPRIAVRRLVGSPGIGFAIHGSAPRQRHENY